MNTTQKKTKQYMETFEIRSYSKKELALCYFPAASSYTTSVKHLMAWINRCKPLLTQLQRQGYNKNAKWFTAREARLIVSHLGEP